MAGPLYKTTIVIWSKADPIGENGVEITDLAFEATEGSMYCSSVVSERVEEPTADPAWDGTDFFVSLDELEEDEVGDATLGEAASDFEDEDEAKVAYGPAAE